MEKEIIAILEDQNESINYDKAQIDFSKSSIDIMQIDEEGYNLSGEKYYSANAAYERLKQIGVITAS